MEDKAAAARRAYNQAYYRRNREKIRQQYSQVKKPSQALTGAIQQGLQNAVAFRGAIAVTDNLPVTCRATVQSKSGRIVFYLRPLSRL